MSSPAKPSVASLLPLFDGLLLICMVGVEPLSVETEVAVSDCVLFVIR